MNSKISILLVFLGISCLFMSFFQRESYEKEVYQQYVEKQKENLLRGWQDSWIQFLKEESLKRDVYKVSITRSGKLINKSFFPTMINSNSKWENFNQLDKTNKKRFLLNQIKKLGSWDRVLALKKISEIDKDFQFKDLSDYELTVLNENAKKSFQMIFKQLHKRKNYTDLLSKVTFDEVLIRENNNGTLDLFVPRNPKKLLEKFKMTFDLSGMQLSGENVFKLELEKGFKPVNTLLIKARWINFFSIALIIWGLIGFLIEIKNRKKELANKVTFLNQLVHEVKTPLTGIRLNAELLQKYGFDQTMLESMLVSANRLNDFFEDVVLINNSKSIKNEREISIDEWKEFVDGLILEFKKIEFENYVSEEMILDLSRMRIIIRNLLKNAVRYGKKGLCTFEIKNNFLIIVVQDEGEGVSVEDSINIFNEFYRAESAKRISPDGMGMGLSIIKKISNELNGSVRLVNPGEKNACFEFKLRIKNV